MPKKGEHPSDVTRKLQSEAKKGKHLSDTTKKLLSEINKGENNPMFGRIGEKCPAFGIHLTGEKTSMFGKHHTKETKKLIGDANRGEKSPMFGKTGGLCPNYGRHHTQEERVKISVAHQLRVHHTKGGGASHLVTIALISSRLESLGWKVESWCTTGERFITIDKHKYSPDIYATKDNNNPILVEVGSCTTQKLCHLMSHYPVVLHVSKLKMELEFQFSKNEMSTLYKWNLFNRLL
jgi:hypothetical protein